MIDMESAFDLLEGDPSGYHLKGIRDELFDMKTAVRQAMDKGMTADEMTAAKRVLAAVECADTVAGKLHDSLNR